MNLIQQIEAEEIAKSGKDIPEFRAGDTVRVGVKVKEGNRERIQNYEGVVIARSPEGWTRSYVLRAIGYCKDADPFTAASDTVEPLPWRGMGRYPFGDEGERPRDPDYRRYLETYQTRRAGP